MTDPIAHEIALLVEAFKAQGWRELRIETDALSLLLSDDPAAQSVGRDAAVRPATDQTVTAAPAAPMRRAQPQPEVAGSRSPSWVAIVAPNLGTFYRSPKPGSEPFVAVGDAVAPGTEICLLEVMKLFTSVTAGITGIVREIVAQDAELVEGGQPLFFIEPQGN